MLQREGFFAIISITGILIPTSNLPPKTAPSLKGNEWFNLLNNTVRLPLLKKLERKEHKKGMYDIVGFYYGCHFAARESHCACVSSSFCFIISSSSQWPPAEIQSDVKIPSDEPCVPIITPHRKNETNKDDGGRCICSRQRNHSFTIRSR